jgi:hypothetical protein
VTGTVSRRAQIEAPTKGLNVTSPSSQSKKAAVENSDTDTAAMAIFATLPAFDP